jgi:Calcineurin-like phosphoesterase
MKNRLKQLAMIIITVVITCSHCMATESNKTSWKFCVTGDSRGSDNGINSAVLKRLVVEIKKEQPEYVLFVGDLVNGYTGAKKLKKQLIYWRDTFMAPLLEAGIAVYPCRGNHDLVRRKRDLIKKKIFASKTANASRTVWNQVFSGKFQLPQNGPNKEKNITYKIAENNAVVLCLDSYMPNQRHRINQQWFNKEIKKVTASKTPLHLFAFSHEPAYSVRHRDCLDDFPEQRDKLVKTFLDAGGRAMFFGHDHRYHHATIPFGDKTLHQFIVGTAGAPWRIWNGKYDDPQVKKIVDASVFGYMLVEINGAQVTITMKGWTKSGKDGKPKIIDTLKYKINQ